MTTNNDSSSTPHQINSDLAAEKDFEKVDVTINRIFELEEDLLPDPVDELLEVTILSEDDLPNEENPNSGITEEIIRKDRLDRARYGVSRRDIWDFGFNLTAIMATGFRKLRDATDDAGEKATFEKLIAGCIALNERGAMNDMAYFKDPEKNVVERKRWDDQWFGAIAEFQDFLNAEWLNISAEPAPFTWNRGTANAIVSRLQGKFAYDEKKDYLTDPITPAVPVEDRNEHLRQRAYEGYSEWDLKHFRTYLIWLIAQAGIFFASTDSMGFPMNEKHDTFEAYSEFLVEFIGDILRGEANTCTDRAMMFDLREQDSVNYTKAVAQFTQVLPGLWD
jgi:hypothetical protein